MNWLRLIRPGGGCPSGKAPRPEEWNRNISSRCGGFTLAADGFGGTDVLDPPPLAYTPFAAGQIASAAYSFGLTSTVGWFARGG